MTLFLRRQSAGPLRAISQLDRELSPFTLGSEVLMQYMNSNKLLTRLVQEESFGILGELSNQHLFGESFLLLPCIKQKAVLVVELAMADLVLAVYRLKWLLTCIFIFHYLLGCCENGIRIPLASDRDMTCLHGSICLALLYINLLHLESRNRHCLSLSFLRTVASTAALLSFHHISRPWRDHFHLMYRLISYLINCLRLETLPDEYRSLHSRSFGT